MCIRTLAEAVILQSLEDLSDFRHRTESIEFFSGTGFRMCAEVAGLDADGKVQLLDLARKINTHCSEQMLKTGLIMPRRFHTTSLPPV
jgi:hypothetical protein